MNIARTVSKDLVISHPFPDDDRLDLNIFDCKVSK